MKILITGGAGYIGYSLIEALFQSNVAIEEIRVYDNLSQANYGLFFAPKFPPNKLSLVQGDLLDSRSLEKALKGVDIVYHLAAKVTQPYSDFDSHFFEQINHWGTAELVNTIEKSSVSSFINLSSTSVYGHSDADIDDETIPQPKSFYANSKLRAEQQAERIFDRLKQAYNLRSGNVYGFNPALRIDAVINLFMFEAHHKGRISIHGDGEQVRSFIHVDKLCQALVALLGAEVPNGTYNLAEYNFSINEIVGEIRPLYPNLETLHINQHLGLSKSALALPVKVKQWVDWSEKSFAEELAEMKAQFAI